MLFALAAAARATHLPGTDWVPIVTGVLIAIGGGGGVAALFKSLPRSPEGSKIVVEAAQGAVVVQTGVIDSLHRALKEAQDQITAQAAEIRELRSHIAEVSVLRQQVRGLEDDNHRLRRENTDLRARVLSLERHAGPP